MAYIPPTDFEEMNKYAAKYMPQWVFPLNLTCRSMMRIFETGLVREKDPMTGRPKPRVVPKKIYEIDDTRCMVEFKGKKGVLRKVEVPFSKKIMGEWYYETAKGYYKESYRNWLKSRWGYGTHDGRKMAVVNFLIINGNNIDSNLEILSRTGHKSLDDLMPYVRDYITVKSMISDADKKIIKKLMSHIIVK